MLKMYYIKGARAGVAVSACAGNPRTPGLERSHDLDATSFGVGHGLGHGCPVGFDVREEADHLEMVSDYRVALLLLAVLRSRPEHQRDDRQAVVLSHSVL